MVEAVIEADREGSGFMRAGQRRARMAGPCPGAELFFRWPDPV